jgi:hypothetical protein
VCVMRVLQRTMPSDCGADSAQTPIKAERIAGPFPALNTPLWVGRKPSSSLIHAPRVANPTPAGSVSSQHFIWRPSSRSNLPRSPADDAIARPTICVCSVSSLQKPRPKTRFGESGGPPYILAARWCESPSLRRPTASPRAVPSRHPKMYEYRSTGQISKLNPCFVSRSYIRLSNR